MLKLIAVTKNGIMEIGNVAEDENQCMNRGDRELDYHVQIEAAPDALNGQGFLIDRHDIGEYFHRKYGRYVPVLPSCEVMAKEAAEDLARMCGGRATKVVVDIGGIVAVWEEQH